MSCTTEIYTIEDYLLGKVKFDVPAAAVTPILFDRGMVGCQPVADLTDDDRKTLRLCYADLLKWLVIGPSKVNNTSDSDNGWTHTGGGYELSDDDIAALKAEANAIYDELEPGSTFAKKATFKIASHGVMRASRTVSGDYLPHVIK